MTVKQYQTVFYCWIDRIQQMNTYGFQFTDSEFVAAMKKVGY